MPQVRIDCSAANVLIEAKTSDADDNLTRKALFVIDLEGFNHVWTVARSSHSAVYDLCLNYRLQSRYAVSLLNSFT